MQKKLLKRKLAENSADSCAGSPEATQLQAQDASSGVNRPKKRAVAGAMANLVEAATNGAHETNSTVEVGASKGVSSSNNASGPSVTVMTKIASPEDFGRLYVSERSLEETTASLVPKTGISWLYFNSMTFRQLPLAKKEEAFQSYKEAVLSYKKSDGFRAAPAEQQKIYQTNNTKLWQQVFMKVKRVRERKKVKEILEQEKNDKYVVREPRTIAHLQDLDNLNKLVYKGLMLKHQVEEVKLVVQEFFNIRGFIPFERHHEAFQYISFGIAGTKGPARLKYGANFKYIRASRCWQCSHVNMPTNASAVTVDHKKAELGKKQAYDKVYLVPILSKFNINSHSLALPQIQALMRSYIYEKEMDLPWCSSIAKIVKELCDRRSSSE